MINLSKNSDTKKVFAETLNWFRRRGSVNIGVNKIRVFMTAMFIMLLPVYLQSTSDSNDDCECKGIKLHGKVKFVENFPDFTIKYVESFPDLKVKYVKAFPDNCGEWQIVENFPDFTVKVVESFPDFTVKVVESFPGTR